VTSPSLDLIQEHQLLHDIQVEVSFTLLLIRLPFLRALDPKSESCLLESVKRMMATYETPSWPASPEHLSAARQFLKLLSSKRDDRPVLIIPDRDVDGLTSGGIMHRVVSRLLLKERKISVPVKFITKGGWIGDPAEKAEIDAINPRY